VQAPTIALAVLIEHAGGGGGKFAAPVAKEILEHWFTRDAGPAPDTKVQEVRSPTRRHRSRRARSLREARAERR
jgi:hypothetical protein